MVIMPVCGHNKLGGSFNINTKVTQILQSDWSACAWL
jgi:hypothetical protein